jgi:hypothetical protein
VRLVDDFSVEVNEGGTGSTGSTHPAARPGDCLGDGSGDAEGALGHGLGGAQGKPGAAGTESYREGYE